MTVKKEMRIDNHPILGKQKKRKKLKIKVDGKIIDAYENEPIIVALLANGIRICRESAKYKKPGGLFCGIGQCSSCIMKVNNIPNVRTCITPVEEGMIIETQHGKGD